MHSIDHNANIMVLQARRRLPKLKALGYHDAVEYESREGSQDVSKSHCCRVMQFQQSDKVDPFVPYVFTSPSQPAASATPPLRLPLPPALSICL